MIVKLCLSSINRRQKYIKTNKRSLKNNRALFYPHFSTKPPSGFITADGVLKNIPESAMRSGILKNVCTQSRTNHPFSAFNQTELLPLVFMGFM